MSEYVKGLERNVAKKMVKDQRGTIGTGGGSPPQIPGRGGGSPAPIRNPQPKNRFERARRTVGDTTRSAAAHMAGEVIEKEPMNVPKRRRVKQAGKQSYMKRKMR